MVSWLATSLFTQLIIYYAVERKLRISWRSLSHFSTYGVLVVSGFYCIFIMYLPSGAESFRKLLVQFFLLSVLYVLAASILGSRIVFTYLKGG